MALYNSLKNGTSLCKNRNLIIQTEELWPLAVLNREKNKKRHLQLNRPFSLITSQLVEVAGRVSFPCRIYEGQPVLSHYETCEV